MKKLFYICGPSSSGKDTVYSALMQQNEIELTPVVLYTTRPKRLGETEGKEYHFVDDLQIESFEKAGKIIEKRVYHTVHGDWTYATVADSVMETDERDYLGIGTIESFVKIRDHFGEAKVWPILLHVDEGERLQRALDREKAQAEPKYAEMCRRFLADAEDFSDENIKISGITRVFENKDFDKCMNEILGYILAKEGK